jgi:F0F1-type ATP synthase assembly protein I
MKSSNDLRSQLARSMAVSTTIGLDFACVLLVSVFLGSFVDGKLGIGPVGLVLGIVFGIVGGGYSAWLLIRRVLQ